VCLGSSGRFVTSSLRSVWTTWLATRILTIGAIAAASAAAGESLSKTWQRWDAGWFLDIAAHGYEPLERGAPAFYPLYPLLLRGGSEVVGGHPVLAGVLLSLPLTLCAFVLLHAHARRFVGEEEARRAVAYVALFPTAFFLSALYSESLFLVFAVAAFLAAERRRFLLAAALAGCAMLTRPLGVAVLAGLVVFAALEPDRWTGLRRLWAAPAVFALYPILLAAQGKGAFAFVSAESEWRRTSVSAALRGPYLTVLVARNGVRDLTAGYDFAALLNVSTVAVWLGFGCLSIVAWRDLGAPYGVYCLVSLAMPLATPADPWPLVSIQRFVLALFPCFIVLGSLPIRPAAHRLLLALSAVTMVWLIVEWTSGEFVA
jgi:Mannosyltransferase (PIG-V)